MDKKEFKTRLAELADFEEVTPRILREEAGQYDQIHELNIDGELVEIDRTCNPTLGIRLIGLKPNTQACELGCGKIIDRQVVEKIRYQTPVEHWRTKCAECGKYQHPSGQGTVEGRNVSGVFGKYYYHKTTQNSAASKPRG